MRPRLLIVVFIVIIACVSGCLTHDNNDGDAPGLVSAPPEESSSSSVSSKCAPLPPGQRVPIPHGNINPPISGWGTYRDVTEVPGVDGVSGFRPPKFLPPGYDLQYAASARYEYGMDWSDPDLFNWRLYYSPHDIDSQTGVQTARVRGIVLFADPIESHGGYDIPEGADPVAFPSGNTGQYFEDAWGIRHLIWREDGFLYALTSCVDEPTMVQVAASMMKS